MDDNKLPPEPDKPSSSGIPDDDEFLNSLFAETRPLNTPPPPDRAGKARDRYQKRREKSPAPDIKAELESSDQRTTPTAPIIGDSTPSGGTRRTRALPQAGQTQPIIRRLRQSQVGTQGGFKLPKFDLSAYSIYAYIGAGVVLLLGVILFLALFKNDPPVTYPNGVWIGNEWTFRAPPESDVIAFAEKLREHRIGTVYAWVSYLKGDNTWSGIAAQTDTFEEVEPNVVRFVSQFREAYPEATLYGWIGFPVDAGVPADDPDGSRLNNPESVEQIADFAAYVVNNLGFHGVMLNAELVWNRDADDYIALLQAVRRKIGNAPLSVAVIPDWSPANANIPVPSSIAPGTEYSVEFKQRIALMVDEIMVMAYNSALNTPLDYVEWVAYQTQAYATAVAAVAGGATIMIGIPTYAETPAHNPAVENIPSAVSGVVEGIRQAGAAASSISGVAIYGSWETDEDEWRLFQRFWVQR